MVTVHAELVREIYLAGYQDRKPLLPTDLHALEAAVHDVLPPTARGYLVGNAGTGATARANRQAFDRWRLVPRLLRDVSQRDLSVTLFGQRLPVPVLLAPIAAQTVAHPDGELATVRAATELDVPFVLSTASSYPLEVIAGSAPDVPRWFQLYWPSDRGVAESLVRRAEASGYSALVLTVDAPTFGYRPADLDNGYLPFLHGDGIANFTSDPVFRAGLPDDADRMTVIRQWAAIFANPGLCWDHLPWLRELTRLPILLKGIVHPDDARRALGYGIDGLVVSNHGGRQLDETVAALDALPAVRAAVGDSVPVLLDSGIRSGPDVMKALALGADAVLCGRPYLYGLALAGYDGVRHVLRCLLADLELAMALTGCTSVDDVTPSLVTAPGVTSYVPNGQAVGSLG